MSMIGSINMHGAGKYRHIVTIQQPVWDTDARGGKTVTGWDDVVKTYARVRPLSGREFWQAQQAQSQIEGVVEMRYMPGTEIRNDMRVLFQGRHLHIEYVMSPNERREELHIYYREAK